jgi:hypothetical protein
MHLPVMHSQEKNVAFALSAMLVPTWLLMHGYQGLIADAQIYAFQAIARIHPQLATDLYLQNTSQDTFTFFSPFYAFFIDHLGLEAAARSLTVIFNVWLYAASWSLARVFTDRLTAFLVVAFVMIVPGDYGASGVFRFSEHYLTARLPAEAMIITALACYFRGARTFGLLLAASAMLVHPLMALPGCLLLICLMMPTRVGVRGAAAAILAIFGAAVAASGIPAVARVITIIDAEWLYVVRERSQFLFLQLWTLHDWSTNAQPLISLILTSAAIQDGRVSKVCTATALVGTTGLAVALVGGLGGPIALLLQGQAWRWVWITVLIGALFVPMTAFKLWRADACGPLCAILLVCGWTVSAFDGTVCVSLALVVWLMRRNINKYASHYIQWSAFLLGAVILGWLAIKSWKIVASASASNLLGDLQGIPALRISTVLIVGLLWWAMRASRTLWRPACLAAGLLLAGALILPSAFHQRRSLQSAAEIQEFSDWSNVIPPSSTVLVTPSRDVGTFVWFTLQRPNYLSLDQSAGVVFSRATSLEVERRSQVLLPLQDPDWKILANIQAVHSGKQQVDMKRPLTAKILTQICSDPQLGFVISPEKVGFNPISYAHDGAWKDWNLYDCGKVRQRSAAT